MRLEEVKTVSALGRAFWPEPIRARTEVAATLGVTSLQDVSEERAMDLAALGLLHKALKSGALDARERFIVIALHVGKWSYSRLAHLLRLEIDEVERAAWLARTRMCQSSPAGGGGHLHCPEVDASRPWTQRFLDDEVSQSQRLYLQNHLMACDSCRTYLERCRDLYYEVDAGLQPLINEGDIKVAARVVTDSRLWMDPVGRTLWQSLRIFGTRTETRWSLAITLGILFLLWVAKK